MRDPVFERFLITRVARIGHFLHDEQLHLFAKIEWTAKQHWLGLIRADAPPEISEIGATHCQRGAGHDAGAIVAKNHSAHHGRDIDRRGVER